MKPTDEQLKRLAEAMAVEWGKVGDLPTSSQSWMAEEFTKTLAAVWPSVFPEPAAVEDTRRDWIVSYAWTRPGAHGFGNVTYNADRFTVESTLEIARHAMKESGYDSVVVLAAIQLEKDQP